MHAQSVLNCDSRGDWSFDCAWSQAGRYFVPNPNHLTIQPLQWLISIFLSQAGIQFTIFEAEPTASHYRPREWSMGIHWSLPQLEALLPPDLVVRLKEAQNDPFWEAPEQDTMKIYSGLDGEILKALPLPRTIRVSRRKMRALCSHGIDVKVCN